MNAKKLQLCVASRAEWRSWLRQNHARVPEVWLVFFKKNTGKQSIEYRDSVEEALCFGWIDGQKRSLDEQSYAYRFTPRRAGSKWSPLNVDLARKMIAASKMMPAGLEAFNRRVLYGDDILEAIAAKELSLTPELEKALKANRKAWENFNKLAPGYRKQYVAWLVSARRQDTIEKRLREVIKLLAANKKLGMK